MIKFIDNTINSITMYRLVLYVLIIITFFAIISGFLGLVPYSGLSQIYSISLLIIVCYLSNLFLSKIFRAHANVESWLITSLILYCLFMPSSTLNDSLTLVLTAVIAMASKYLFAVNKKHIFNPAAIAAVLLSFNPGTVALWWVGNPVLTPVILIGGLLIVRKIRKFNMFFTFLIVSFLSASVNGILTNNFNVELFKSMVTSGPLFFLGTIMLTEPLTTPPTKKLQLIYGGSVGLLSSLQFNIGPVYSTPELALVIGNIFSFIVSPKLKLELRLKEKKKIAKDIYEFVFEKPPSNSPLPQLRLTRSWGESTSSLPDKGGLGWVFKSGQYLEWTVPHKNPDSRGVRRYFTIASSPTEKEIKLGVRISNTSSSFKNKLLSIESNNSVVAAQLAGDFVLPEEKNQKLVFIAGGIGITPFRSMIKYLYDSGEKRSVTLFYFNKTEEEIAYKELFDQAVRGIGLKTVYVLTDPDHIPAGWTGRKGRLDNKMLSEEISDIKNSIYYLSGPNALVNNYKLILLNMGVSRKNIRTDFFPGF